jgi:flagellar hook-associated protein 1 FlgK
MTGNAHGLEFNATVSTGVDTANALGDIAMFGRSSSDMSALGLEGGTLEAAFNARDAVATDYAAGLDALARDLVERFQSATIASGGETDAFMADYDFAQRYEPALPGYDVAAATGLFTDEGGARFDAAVLSEAGFAGRIAFNAALDPAQGGSAALLQTGLYSGAPRPGGASETFPRALYDAFTGERHLFDVADNPGATLGVLGARSAVDMVSEWSALQETAAGRIETQASFQRGATEAMRDEELAAKSVDTDEELSNLLRIEQAYAANARVLEAVEQMISRLLQI